MPEGRYRLFETRQYISDLEKLDASVRSKIQQKLSSTFYPQLRNEPHFGLNIRKLSDWKPECWRYRIGTWRFFYEIHEQEKIVYLIAVDHRREAYR